MSLRRKSFNSGLVVRRWQKRSSISGAKRKKRSKSLPVSGVDAVPEKRMHICNYRGKCFFDSYYEELPDKVDKTAVVLRPPHAPLMISDHRDVRNACVEYLKTRASYYQEFVPSNAILQHIERVSKHDAPDGSNWAGEIEISATCNALQHKVKIVAADNFDRVIHTHYPTSWKIGDPEPTEIVMTYNGCHYESYKKAKSLEPERKKKRNQDLIDFQSLLEDLASSNRTLVSGIGTMTKEQLFNYWSSSIEEPLKRVFAWEETFENRRWKVYVAVNKNIVPRFDTIFKRLKALPDSQWQTFFPGAKKPRKAGIAPVIRLLVSDKKTAGTMITFFRNVKAVMKSLAKLDSREKSALEEMRKSGDWLNLPVSNKLECYKRMPISTLKTWVQPKYSQEDIIENIARCSGAYRKPYAKDLPGTIIIDEAALEDFVDGVENDLLGRLELMPDEYTMQKAVERFMTRVKKNNKTWVANGVKRKKLNQS